MTVLRQNEDFPCAENETDGTTDDELESLFDESDESDDDTRDTDILTNESDGDTGSDAWQSDEEDQRPPEYYLAEASNLDVKRLRQRRYSPKTQERLDWVKDHWHRYCIFVRKDPGQCYSDLTAHFLKGFLSWVCDQRRGKGGRRRPGLGHTSSLETFWKWYQLVYKLEVGKKIDDMIIRQGQDVVKIVADEKGLSNAKRESATMYVEDLAEFARVLLATSQMTFEIGWLRVQLILFCQLAGITGNRPEALVSLRFRHLNLTLIRDRNADRPRLFIELTAEYTKRYLGIKDANEFVIPEIIFDPTLVLSPHVFLLGMLFKARAFKSPSIDSPERLYSLDILHGLNEQALPLREELDEDFLFCQAVREAHGIRIAHELQLSSDSVRYRMKKGGQITGFSQVTKPYVLRDGAAKALNESPDVSDSLQNLILQHASIDTFLKHYLDRRINADLLKIHRGMKPEKELMRFACSMSRSIDPRRPWKLTTEQSASINDLPCIVKLARRTGEYSGAPEGSPGAEKYLQACRRLGNEKQRQRRLLLLEIVDRFKKEQPVIDSERQLSGKVVSEDTRGALERSDEITPEQLLLIDAILTLPATSLAGECQRRIAAIHAVTAYCGVEEGQPCSRRRGRPRKGQISPVVRAADQARSTANIALSQAISSIKTDERPTICFLCLGNPALPIRERVVLFATPGSLSRHFLRKHVRKLQDWEHIDCRICDMRLEHRQDLQNHAERFHGTVSRRNS